MWVNLGKIFYINICPVINRYIATNILMFHDTLGYCTVSVSTKQLHVLPTSCANYYLLPLAHFGSKTRPAMSQDLTPLDYFLWGTSVAKSAAKNHKQEKSSCSESCCPLTAWGDIMKLSERQ
jgi:hypothetical protein